MTSLPSTFEPARLAGTRARPTTRRSGAEAGRWARRAGQVLLGVASVVLLGDLGP